MLLLLPAVFLAALRRMNKIIRTTTSMSKLTYIEFTDESKREERLAILKQLVDEKQYDMMSDTSFISTFKWEFLDVDVNKVKSLFADNPSVAYINHAFSFYKGNCIVVPTNAVEVKPKQGYDVNKVLDSFFIQTVNIEKYENGNGIYCIYLLKEENSLTVANKLYETGLFKYSQPGFHWVKGGNGPQPSTKD